MSKSFDLVQTISLSWSWDEIPYPRNSTYCIRREKDTGEFYIMVEGNPHKPSAAYDVLKATIGFYLKKGGNPHSYKVTVAIKEDKNVSDVTGILKELNFTFKGSEPISDSEEEMKIFEYTF